MVTNNLSKVPIDTSSFLAAPPILSHPFSNLLILTKLNVYCINLQTHFVFTSNKQLFVMMPKVLQELHSIENFFHLNLNFFK